jgi:hypothetical protein
MGFYISRQDGEYYEGDLRYYLDIEMKKQRPSQFHIPNEDYTDWVLNLNPFKENKKKEILVSFENEFRAGHFMSTSLGIEVDFRRSDIKNDLQNVDSLIAVMELQGLTSTDYKGYTETKPGVTIPELRQLITEMQVHGVLLYQKRWTLEAQIDAATTEAEVNSINW